VAPAFARACSAGPSPVWRISSVTRPRRSRGHRTERGPTAGRHHCGCILGRAGSRLARGPAGPGQARCTDGPGSALGGPGPAHPAIGPLTSRRRSANGATAGRRHRTPRCGLGRGLRADRAIRRSRSVSPCQSRSRHRGSVPVRRQPCYGPCSFPLIPKHRCKLLHPPPRPV
jgi:hypothetical protein